MNCLQSLGFRSGRPGRAEAALSPSCRKPRDGQVRGAVQVAARASAAVALFVLAAMPAQAAPRGGFADYAGAWTGSGRVVSSDGSEAIRCRAQYQVSPEGESVQQHLVCASASYQFNIDCRATDSGGQVSGSWTETTRGITGSLSGSLRSGRMQAVVNSPLFSASLSLVTRGNAQEVVISPQDQDIRQVTVRLRRG